MKIKVSEATPPQINWMVAKAIGEYKPVAVPAYSTDWAQAGPIIEREGIAVMRIEDRQAHQQWAAGEHDSEYAGRLWEVVCGPTPLIAAMRAYVASKMGNVVDVPEELL